MKISLELIANERLLATQIWDNVPWDVIADESATMNCQIATILQDHPDFVQDYTAAENGVKTTPKPYLFGKLSGLDLYCDPILTWSNNIIKLKSADVEFDLYLA